jgi:iron complex outermembrane receptor protein
MKKLRLVLLLLVLGAEAASAQISGTVSDLENHPLAGVEVGIEGSFIRTFTDGKGRFQLVTGDTGNYRITFRKEGFEPFTSQPIPVFPFVRLAPLDIRLEAAAIRTETVHVSASRVESRSPGAFSQMDKKELRAQNLGQDIPILLNFQPGVVSTSDAGAGIGYTGIRVRGSDATRINVTLNGMPLNDAESHGVFWVNMPDLASSLQSIQLQRGVGSSTNGPGAFGATLNMVTDGGGNQPYAELNQGIGSFRTRRTTFKGATGLINKHWDAEFRLSSIQSDGYIDRASSNLESFYAAIGYRDARHSFRLIHFRGRERTYQSWWGTPEALVKGNDSLLRIHYLNNAGIIYNSPADSANLFESGRTYNYYRYENQVDNYGQDHLQALYTYRINRRSDLSLAYHYTHGEGYFEEARDNQSFYRYGVPDIIRANDTIRNTNLVRRRWLRNDFNGFSANYRYRYGNWNVHAGGAALFYDGQHFGQVIWAREAITLPKDHQYYYADGRKTDANVFLKSQLEWGDFLLFGDLQYRRVSHNNSGTDNDLRRVNFRFERGFFNPKAGIVWRQSQRSQWSASVNVAHREPNRSDFTDRAPATGIPEPERMIDWEAGYRYNARKWLLVLNAYYMDYFRQLVLTGMVNDVGNPLRQNVDRSYRAGIELEGAWQMNRSFRLEGNLSLSQNRITAFNERIANYDLGTTDQISHRQTPIAFSPGSIAAAIITWTPVQKLDITLLNKWVGSQYLDNTGSKDAMLDAYFTNDLRITWKAKRDRIEFSLLANNLLNRMYASNGYTYRYIFGNTQIRENFLYPQAGFNWLACCTLRF